MGLFGGSKTRQPNHVIRANELLLEVFFPGLQTGGKNNDGISGQIQDFFWREGLNTGPEGGWETTLAPLGGGTGTANPFLPSLEEIGTFNTVFEKYSNGSLDPSSSLIMDTMLLNLQGGEGSVFAQTMSGMQGGVTGSIGTPDFSRLEFIPPENTGTYTSEIYNALPSQFQVFIDDVMSGGTQASIDAELDNLSQALMTEAQLNASSLGTQLLGAFAANGLGASGSAAEAMKGLAAEVTIRVNAQVAQARLQAMDTLIRNKQVAAQTLDTMVQSGTAERLQDVQGQIAAIDAVSRVMASQLAVQAQIQTSLFNAQAHLGAAQLGFIENAFNQLVAQSTQEEVFRQTSQLLPFQILSDIGSSGGQVGKTGSGFLGDALGAVAGVGTAAILASDLFKKTDVTPTSGGASDYRLKTSIGYIATTAEGFPLYEYSYIDDPQKRRYRGVMAQDLMLLKPEAVYPMGDGYFGVDYSKLSVDLEEVT